MESSDSGKSSCPFSFSLFSFRAEEVSEAERVAAAAKAETAALAAEAAESKQTRKVALAQLHTRLNKV